MYLSEPYVVDVVCPCGYHGEGENDTRKNINSHVDRTMGTNPCVVEAVTLTTMMVAGVKIS